MHKRNKKYAALQGELEGLKKFIKTAEVDKLKALVEENPSYFYNVLPFAYIFNLSDKWIKQFEKLTELNVEWNSSSKIDVNKFGSFIKSMNAASETYYTGTGSSSGSGGWVFIFKLRRRRSFRRRRPQLVVLTDLQMNLHT
jgi:hypothetical protein